MAVIVAISNNKGGVAKTTTCLSLGACLAEMGLRTLIVDLDPQADLTLALGLDAESLSGTLADVLLEGDGSPPVSAVRRTTAVPALDVLPSDPRLAGAERHLYQQTGYELRLRQALAPVLDDYAYVLLDCPPSLGGLMLMALSTARWVLVPVQCEYYAARRLLRLLEVIAAVRERTNPELSYYLLATLYDGRTRLGRGVLEQLKTNFSAHLLDTVIPVNAALRESAVAAEPVTLYAPRSRGCQEYRNLAREFHQRLQVVEGGEHGS